MVERASTNAADLQHGTNVSSPRQKLWTVRNAAISVTISIALSASYVVAWMMLPAAEYHGIISMETWEATDPLWMPITLYLRTDLPGRELLLASREDLSYYLCCDGGNWRTPLVNNVFELTR
jgi:hypothetical protein